MIDHFAALRQMRRPWLDPEKLKEEYHQLTLAEHPDRGDRRTDASSTFAAVNDAYKVLSNDKLRLQHLLNLEGLALSPAAAVPEDIVNLFSEVGALVRRVDDLLQKRDAATSSLSKSLFRPEILAMQERIAALLQQLQTIYDKGTHELRQLDEAWTIDSGAVLERLTLLWRRFAYLERWMKQIREQQFQLSN